MTAACPQRGHFEWHNNTNDNNNKNDDNGRSDNRSGRNLQHACSASDTNHLHILTHLSLTRTWWGRPYFDTHFTDDENEAQAD